jgi:hypothetical protein
MGRYSTTQIESPAAPNSPMAHPLGAFHYSTDSEPKSGRAQRDESDNIPDGKLGNHAEPFLLLGRIKNLSAIQLIS